MKTTYPILLLLGFVVLVSACQKDFLERTPKTAISERDYWKTENDLRLYVNNYYNQLPSYIGAYLTAGIFSADENTSDNMINRNYSTFLNGEATLPASGSWNYGAWSDIRSVNYFLGNYQQASGTPAVINKYLGEVLFFKAMFYYNKLKVWGDLPWISHIINLSDSTELYAPRVSRAIIVDSMMSILDKAIEYLPSKGESGYENFRIYKELAALLQSRIALYEGTWEKYHAGTPFGVPGSNGTKFLQKAATAAQIVINSEKFDLDNIGVENGYWNLFNQTSYANSKEVMFWRQYNAEDGIYTLIARYMTTGGGRGITKSLVDAYLATDGKPIAVSPLYKGDATLIQVTTNRDPRLSQTIHVNDGKHFISDTSRFWHPAWEGANEDKDYTGYQLYKGLNTSKIQQEVGKGTQGLIYYRYPEALLNYIEARAELGQATQADIDATINKLRRRVGMPNLVLSNITSDPNWQFPNLSPLINEVRRERRVEFAVEGYRRDDIWRWAAAGRLLKGWKPRGAKRKQFLGMGKDAIVTGLYPVDENDYIFPYKNNVIGANGYNFKVNRDYLAPIPTDQLLLNKQLKQNPGWQ